MKNLRGRTNLQQKPRFVKINPVAEPSEIDFVNFPCTFFETKH